METNDQKSTLICILLCMYCKNATKHQLAFTNSENFSTDPEYDPSEESAIPQTWEEQIYKVWKCAGCGSARFEITTVDHGYSPDNEITQYYPEFNPKHRQKKYFPTIPRILSGLYQETVLCFNTGAYIACAACLRALLEGILIDQGIDKGKKSSLYQRIDKLRNIPLVPDTAIELLHSFRFMGNEALHELVKPSEVEMRYAIEAMEQLIYYIYEANTELHNKLRTLSLLQNK